MKSWPQRPREIRNLFNPAFCGLLLVRAIKAYEEQCKQGMPFSLTLLVLPLCLHGKSRETIHAGRLSYLLKIIENHPELVVGFADRTRNLLPYTFEALGFLTQLGSIRVFPEGTIGTLPKCVKATISGGDESKSCQGAARLLGKKLAMVGDRVTIYTSFGIRP